MIALFASLGALLGATDPHGNEHEAPPPAWIYCTTNSYEIAQGGIQESEHPIARALEKAGPGTVVYLDLGNYGPFTIGFDTTADNNAITKGGAPSFPIVVDAAPGTRIVGRGGEAISITQDRRNANITFKNLTIVPGERAGIMFYRQGGGKVHRGYSFEDCHIKGQWDPFTGEGRKTKWGVWGHSLANFRYVGVREPARISRIANEHAFYLQNHKGPITIENVEAKYIGRCFAQFTARKSEGKPGSGDITIRNCVAVDCGIAPMDGWKGGSAFTFAGRLDCTILLERNVYRAGFRSEIRKLTLPDIPYGTGALVAWQAGEPMPNGTLLLRDNHFSFAKDCGDRPVVSVGGTRKVLLMGTNTFVSGGEQPALSIDPINEADGELTSPPNGHIYVSPQTKIEGPFLIRGQKPTPKQLEKLQRQGSR
jgi:hypothetical protein